RINTLSYNFPKRDEMPVTTFKGRLNKARQDQVMAARLLQSRLGTEESSLDFMPELLKLEAKAGTTDPAEADLKSLLKTNTKSNSLSAILKSYAKVENQKNDWLLQTASSHPHKIVEFDGFKMQARTALKFRELKKAINEKFPDRGVYVTSTMGGKHQSPAHPDGRAVDFVIDNLSVDESIQVAKLAEDQGFYVYNEYIYDSPYKTGDHLHIEL
ncbi:MAG: hypothetical protein ACLFQV_11830, partial [Vulcanimicrobiota bacterium]